MSAKPDPESRFPKIDFYLLIRLAEECEIPTKKLRDQNAVGAWRLAKRIKHNQTHAQAEDRMEAAGHVITKTDPSKCQDWANTVDFLTAALSKRKFYVLDEFCKAWGTWAIVQDLIADTEGGGPILTSGHVTNKKRRPRPALVVQAILNLQGRINGPNRAPSYQEILAESGNLDGARGMDDSELSKHLKDLGLQNAVPHQCDLRS
jgi:hypothetical protein